MTGKFRLIMATFACVCLWGALFSACSRDDAGKDASIVATINTYTLTRDEFNAKLSKEMEFNQEYKATKEARKAFLNSLIRKEVLIQEAVAQELNKNKSFIEAIEKYWEATLIKTLMESKMADIRQKTLVKESEIEKRYQTLSAAKEDLGPLEDLEKDIADTLKAEKQTAMVEDWIEELIDEADIKIFDKDLRK